ncbi:trapp complex subunit [Lasallia pustulata]|uniref:Trafficking protein particle complex subunit n=1 Tax=Lasallia pustulata TaxID=136370 RepID=A0A1W5D767_9LECA|nr:trapp complex subunit [Lasallia pustulata]
MVVYSFYIFDRHADCIYKKKWIPRPISSSAQSQSNGLANNAPQPNALSAEDDAKLIFGTIFSLRNMVRKLGGPDDNFISYRTGHYKLHYYETPTSLKFVMVTDTKTNNLRIVLHQIYVSLYVEYVVKNPLSPIEHPGGLGVNCQLFELGLEQFIHHLFRPDHYSPSLMIEVPQSGIKQQHCRQDAQAFSETFSDQAAYSQRIESTCVQMSLD